MTGLVLIAEGDPFNLRLLQELCEEAGYDVVTADDGSSALTVVARQRPVLIMLDIDLKTDDGAEVLEVLRSDGQLSQLPILITTSVEDEAGRRRAIELGADDFVTRPYKVFEVEQRIRTLLRLAAAERAIRQAETGLSTHPGDEMDPLTHTGGAAQLRISLDYEATRAVRYGHAMTCMVLRVKNFSDIVRASGEETGQGLLLQLSSGLRSTIRAVDHLFRSDIDQFTVLLPETTPEHAKIVADRLVTRAHEGSLVGLAIEPRPLLQLGYAAITPGGPFTDGEMLRRAAVEGLRDI